MSLRLSWILPALALFVSCGTPMRMDGASVREQFGRLVVDEVNLEHRRSVSVQGELSDTSAEMLVHLATHTGPIDLVGGPANTYEFLVTVESEVDGDGIVELVDGVLQVRSPSGKTCVINGIRGRLPERVSLNILSSSGSVALQDFSGQASIQIQAPAGSVVITESRCETLDLIGSLGFAKLQDVIIQNFDLQLGTGSIQAINSEFGEVDAVTATGEMQFSGCRVREGSFRSATGSLRLLSTQISQLKHSLGSGRLHEDKTAR